MCLWIEEVLENGTAGERSPRERSDELARVRRRHDGDAGPELRELTQQVDGLVRGDAAGDAEDQLLVRELMLGRDHAHSVPPDALSPWARRRPSRDSQPCPARSLRGRRWSAWCAGAARPGSARRV